MNFVEWICCDGVFEVAARFLWRVDGDGWPSSKMAKARSRPLASMGRKRVAQGGVGNSLSPQRW